MIGGGEIIIIDDSYNASPASMRAAFAKMKALREAGVAKGRLVAVLGDMLEMGDESVKMHAALAEDLESEGIDVVLAAGDAMKHCYNALPETMRGEWVTSASELDVKAHLYAGDTVLFKGSNLSLIHI